MQRPAFGALLREFRLKAGLGQETLAERAGLSAQTISTLERGARLAPQRYTLGLLMDALELGPGARAQFEAAAAASSKARVRVAERKTRPTLPVAPNAFFGRERERAELAVRVRSGRCVTVWGSGGVGKTRLTLETARDVATRFADGAWFVDLAAIGEADDVARAVASAIGIRETDDRPLEEHLADELAEKRGLLLLDNAEHVLTGCARLVSAVLSRGTKLAIVCTSREPLRIEGEDVFALEPMPLPVTGAGGAPSAAAQLFADRAASAGCPVQPSDAGAVAEICRRLDAIPLAIELAAARAPMMSASQILAGLDDRFQLLTRSARNVASRHQTLQAAFAWSYELASERERIVLRRIAVWQGAWTLEDAVAIAGETLDRWSVIDAVASLVDRSLVTVDSANESGERRYRLLQTVALFGVERLREAGDERASRTAAAQRVRAAANAAIDAWRGADDRPLRDLELAAVRAALRWTLGDGDDPELAAAIAGDTALLWDFRGLNREGLEWIDRARSRLSGRSSEGAARCCIGEARLARRLLLGQRSYDAARRAAAIACDIGDERLGAIATLLSVYPLAAAGRHEEGRRALREASDVFQRIGDAAGYQSCLTELAFLAVRAGAFDEARESLVRLLPLFAQRGNRRAHAQTTIDLAEVEFLLGDERAAISRAAAILEEVRERGEWSLVEVTLRNLAGYHLAIGDVAVAYARAREALEVGGRHDFAVGAALALGHLAEVLVRTGRARDAALLLGYVDRRLDEHMSEREALEQSGYDRCRELCERELGAHEAARLIDEGAELDFDEARRLAASRPSIVRSDSATA